MPFLVYTLPLLVCRYFCAMPARFTGSRWSENAITGRFRMAEIELPVSRATRRKLTASENGLCNELNERHRGPRPIGWTKPGRRDDSSPLPVAA
jgi:hypothetical protein